jgi:hypothetical protein
LSPKAMRTGSCAWNGVTGSDIGAVYAPFRSAR